MSYSIIVYNMAKYPSIPVVGIDLGTTFSCIAYYNQGKAEVIPDRMGDRLIPSFVFYDPTSGRIHVGKIAYDLATNYPSNGIRDVKRVIGRKYDDEFLTKYRNLPEIHFSIVKGNDDLAAYEIEIKGKKIIKTPEEVSSEILKYLKEAASKHLDRVVTDAVVSIPAYFSNSQRKATKRAAELAGLRVLKLVTEPVAGAIHYSMNRNMKANLVVVDWGGGTLDVSFIEVNNKTFTVKAVAGDTLLGGRNIDEILFKHFYIPVKRFPDLFKQRLLQECIIIKERLSCIDKIKKIMDCVNGLNDLKLSLTREKFEELTQSVFEKVMDIVEFGLSGTGWNKSNINEVLLIGGSTRIPKLSNLLQTIFGANKLKTDLNPDEAVACGACIKANLVKSNHPELQKYRITEVTPLSLGISNYYNCFQTLIPKNSSLPVSKEDIFQSGHNNQLSATIVIFEGERKNCDYNNKLGLFHLKNLPPCRAGGIKILVKFNLDEDGILTVTAQEVNSSKSISSEVAMGEFWLSGRNVQASIEEAKKHKQEDDIFENYTTTKLQLRSKCSHILYDLEKISSETEKKFVKTKCEGFLELVDHIHDNNIDELNNSFTAMYDSVSPIITKYNSFFSFFWQYWTNNKKS